MRTLLQIDELENGEMVFQSAECPEPIYCFIHLEELVHQLRKNAPLSAQAWITFFGIAQQMLDRGMYTPRYEDEYPDYDYYEEDDYWRHDTDEVPRLPEPKPVYNPEMDPEWQMKRMTITEELKAWRQEKAEKWGVHDYDIIKHTVLADIARAMPLSREELLDVRGVGELTLARHGEDILSVVKKALESFPEAAASEAEDGGGADGGADDAGGADGAEGQADVAIATDEAEDAGGPDGSTAVTEADGAGDSQCGAGVSPHGAGGGTDGAGPKKVCAPAPL